MSKKALAAIDALAAWINRKPTAEEVVAADIKHQADLAEAHKNLDRCTDDPEFINACAVFAQYGMSADDLNKLGHAMVHNRMLAFGYGVIVDVGQRMALPGAPTRLTEPYEGDQL